MEAERCWEDPDGYIYIYVYVYIYTQRNTNQSQRDRPLRTSEPDRQLRLAAVSLRGKHPHAHARRPPPFPPASAELPTQAGASAYHWPRGVVAAGCSSQLDGRYGVDHAVHPPDPHASARGRSRGCGVARGMSERPAGVPIGVGRVLFGPFAAVAFPPISQVGRTSPAQAAAKQAVPSSPDGTDLLCTVYQRREQSSISIQEKTGLKWMDE